MMKKIYYSYAWETRSILVRKKGQIVYCISLQDQGIPYPYLETLWSDGNFIMSTKYDGINPCIYQHYCIYENNGEYSIVEGKKWDDGEWKSFSKRGDGLLELTRGPELENSLYDCFTFEEYYLEKSVQKGKTYIQ